MNKALFLIGTVILLSSAAQAERPRMTKDQEFSRTYKRVLEMNQARFADLKKIPVGTVILIPSRWDERDTEMLELMPPVDGKHDCIWRLVHRYVYGEPTISVKEVAAPNDTIVVSRDVATNISMSSTDAPSKSNRLWWLAILPIIPLTIGGRKWWQKKHDPDSYPPVGENLDSLEPAAVVAEIQRVFEKNGNKVLEVKRGTLRRFSGPSKIKVRMKFGDGQDRNVWIFPNESVCKIKIRNIFGNESYEYCRSACTNGMVIDKFELPKGWEFVTDQETLRPVTGMNTEPQMMLPKEDYWSFQPRTEQSVLTEPVVPPETILLPKRNKKVSRCKRCRRCKKFRRHHKNCKRFNYRFGKKCLTKKRRA